MKKIFGMAIIAACLSVEASFKKMNSESGVFKLAPLPYAANSLEKAFDEKTMLIHHGKHHQAYVDNLNKALDGKKVKLIDLLTSASTQSATIRNNSGGHWNHTFFWSILSGKESDNKVSSRMMKVIVDKWQSFENFQAEFEKAGAGHFGSGWVWLVRTTEGLEIMGTPNQDNPLMDVVPRRGWPILAADVWEHAYYLRYENKRPEYLKNFWKVVNWKAVDQYDKEALKTKLP